MNTIRVDFQPCEPTPSNGYRILYRPIGDVTPFRIHPVNFTSSPAVFDVHVDPAGTSYEGFIQGDCGGGKYGVLVPWLAIQTGSFSFSESESASVPEPGLCFNVYRGLDGDDGAWSGNSSVLNACAQLSIPKKDRFSNDIAAPVQALEPGDIITLILESNPVIRARYVIDSIIFELSNSITFNVTNIDGTAYPITGSPNFTMCFDYGSASESGG